MIRIALYGALGRMGLAITEAALECADVVLAAAVERPGHPGLGLPVSAGDGMELTVTDDAAAAAAAADVLVSFAEPAASVSHAELGANASAGVVIGTTGLSAEEHTAVADAAERVPIVLAPNMSVGVNVLTWLAGRAASAFGPGYDVEIIEAHHRHKADAPSGTALRLAETIAGARGLDLASSVVYGRRGRTGERAPGQIGIHAVRAGDLAGEHRVLFGGEGECFELVHRSSSRAAYARGTLDAVRFVHGRAPGLYDMFDVLGLDGAS